ncbi:MAG: glycosyltransferase family 39 protein [Pyrinomonadaceae bacterium]|nr:glycosyltransferase family 39 protein [Pyrinomonadaceae bacterium]
MIGNKHWLMDDAARNFERARLALATYRVEALCAGILLAMSLNLVAVTARKSITADELVLIPAAYYHLVTNDFQLVSEHPPLCKILAGLPLLFVQPNELAPQQINPSSTRAEREWSYSMRFWEDNRARFDTISFWARMPMIALTLALGVLIFFFARDLFGPRAALLAVALFALEPTILAHARVVQTDIPAAFGFLLSAFALHRYLRAPNWKLACGVGAAAGVALLGKYSMIIVGPILFLVFLVLLWRQPHRRAALAGHAVAAALALLLVVNAGYFFHNRALTQTDSQWVATSFPTSTTTVLTSVRALRVVLPADFVMGVYWQLHHSRDGHAASLLGMYSQRGWWYYFPVAFALKTTIPFLLCSLISIAWCAYRLIWKREWRLLVLLVPFALYTVFMVLSPLNIGIRYYLPAYSFLFILSGGLLNSLLSKNPTRRTRLAWVSVVVIALSWMCLETLRAYPNYTPYMNQLASSRPHWWYLSDSNVEWGDEVKELAAYLQARGETRAQALLLGGYVTLGFYGVNYVDALAEPSESPPRYTALGASFLNGSTVPFYNVDGKRVSDEARVNTFDSFRHRTPEAVIGNSIYVYRMHD